METARGLSDHELLMELLSEFRQIKKTLLERKQPPPQTINQDLDEILRLEEAKTSPTFIAHLRPDDFGIWLECSNPNCKFEPSYEFYNEGDECPQCGEGVFIERHEGDDIEKPKTEKFCLNPMCRQDVSRLNHGDRCKCGHRVAEIRS